MTLLQPFTLRGVRLSNRVVVPPMSQYRVQDGAANDWHLVHLGRFALGGAGLVCCEATAVEQHGGRTHGDLGRDLGWQPSWQPDPRLRLHLDGQHRRSAKR